MSHSKLRGIKPDFRIKPRLAVSGKGGVVDILNKP
jgi:hypothetical protein